MSTRQTETIYEGHRRSEDDDVARKEENEREQQNIYRTKGGHMNADQLHDRLAEIIDDIHSSGRRGEHLTNQQVAEVVRLIVQGFISLLMEVEGSSSANI